MTGKRKKLGLMTEADVLTRSRHRCALCYGLYRDTSTKRGQIAHLDQNPSNGDPDNLAFLCLEHHDCYDSTTSQSKNFAEHEVKRYRYELYEFLSNPALVLHLEASRHGALSTAGLQVIAKYVHASYEAVKEVLGSAGAVAVIISILGIYLLKSSGTYGLLVDPFLVGHWESTTRLETNAWLYEPTPIGLTLYDDNIASLDGLKGSWTFADVSRSVVRIEIPSRDKDNPGRIYELRVQGTEPLWGTMRYSGSMRRFRQVDQGGALGVVAQRIHMEHRESQELREKVCAQTGWRRTAYLTYIWLSSEGRWKACDEADAQHSGAGEKSR